MSVALLASASLVVAPVPKSASFGDWVVACDNVRHCEALALPSEDGSQSEWTLYVSRGPMALSSPTVSADPAFGDWEGEPRPVRLVIDGRRTAFGFYEEGKGDDDGMAKLAAIAKAREVSVVDLSGKTLGKISVTGASAALRWMDDRQKRAGTVTAIIARGSGPASSVPPPPPLPTVKQPPASSAPPLKLSASDIKAVQALADCEPERAEASTYRLDAGHTLGIVGCFMGAYQGASLVVVIDEKGRWTPAPIEQPEPPHEYWKPYDAYFLTEAAYIESERLLFSAAKGRGLADCGRSASWAWDGKVFRLARYIALHECRGAAPGEWLSRWQTTNDPLKEY